MPKDRPKWISLRILLYLALVLWNGYFLAALIYEQVIQTPNKGTVTGVLVWLLLVGDAAILLCFWALRTIVRRRRPAA